MSTQFQRTLYTITGCSVAVLGALGVGLAAGQNSTHQPPPRTVTITKTTPPQIVRIPGKTITVKIPTVSPACQRMVTDTNDLLSFFNTFVGGYGGVREQLNNAFDAIAMHDEAALNAARIKLANMDSTSEESYSGILNLMSQVQNDQKACES